MATYPKLSGLVTGLTPKTAAAGFSGKVVPYLVGVWLDDYCRSTKKNEIVETTVSGFSYLFDIVNWRNSLLCWAFRIRGRPVTPYAIRTIKKK